jgi:N-acyl-L-homoserine lactone synthetase
MLSLESVDFAFAQMVESARRAGFELERAGIPHRIVGGVAVFLHMDAIEPIVARLTPDVDLAVQEATLAAASRALESSIQESGTPYA